MTGEVFLKLFYRFGFARSRRIYDEDVKKMWRNWEISRMIGILKGWKEINKHLLEH